MSITDFPTNSGRKFTAVSTRANTELAGELAERVMALVHEYDDRIPLALAIGVLRIVELDLIAEAK